MISLIVDNLPLIGIIVGIIAAPFALFFWALTIVTVLNQAAENIHNNRHEKAEEVINQRLKS